MISSLKKVDIKIVNEKLEEYDVNSIEALAKFIIEEFKEILSSSKDDVFTQMFFERLVNNENSIIFSAYEQDVECFTVFVYENGDHYSYYIPDEIRKIIRDELKFWYNFKQDVEEVKIVFESNVKLTLKIWGSGNIKKSLI